MKACMIAGTHSGCGKTTFTMGLMALLKQRGHRIAPFKTGPDFIDPMFHEAVTGRSSYNLDSWLLEAPVLRALFARHAQDATMAMVEGVMGFHDGMGSQGRGSSAELARTLGLPVFLVIDCKGLYQSVAAQVAGYRALDPRCDIRGVLLNNVGSEAQYRAMGDFIHQHTGVEAIGWLPPSAEVEIGSRHLGLIQAEEIEDLGGRIASLVATLEKTVDVERLLALSERGVPRETSASAVGRTGDDGDALAPFRHDLSGLRLAVARDRAFRFYYRDNLELLADCGAEILEFSPLADPALPAGCNALYVGGGYPEVFAGELAANRPLRDAIRAACHGGLPTFAECGGLMYLCASLRTEGKDWPMAGVFNCSTEMTGRLQRFGYAEIEYAGATSRCHEFHRSRVVPQAGTDGHGNSGPDYQFRYSLRKPETGKEWQCGLQRERSLAGYAHLHWYSSAPFTAKLMEHFCETM